MKATLFQVLMGTETSRSGPCWLCSTAIWISQVMVVGVPIGFRRPHSGVQQIIQVSRLKARSRVVTTIIEL